MVLSAALITETENKCST